MKKTIKKLSKNNKKFFYVQEWGSYTNQTLVCVGMTANEIVSASKKLKSDKEFIDFLDKDIRDEVDKLQIDGSNGMFTEKNGASLLWLKVWENTWKSTGVLIHELSHAIYMILDKSKGMMDEVEAKAYQQEYLFHQIRSKLDNHFFPKKR